MTRELGRFSLIFLLLRLSFVSGSLDFFELNNAQYEFNIDIKPQILDEIPDDNDTMITVANKHGQKFVCSLPERPQPKEKDLMSGSSVNPKIAAEQITKHLSKCIKLKTGWWTYTLCPRKSITQSHGKDGDVDFASLSLGMFTGNYAMPTKMSTSEGEKMLYLEEKYDMGTVCDITGAPRTAVVRYSCEPVYTAKDALIHAVDEEASCEYRVDVRTGALCSIPQFLPPKAPETQPIRCSPVISAAAAEKLKKADENRKKNKEKARREIAAIKAEYDETKTRRWSIERRRLEVRDEEFNLKMRDLDEDYIDLTRDQLEWNIIAQSGEDPTPETRETINDLLDSMEAIETAQVTYDSIVEEDRANLWHYFHNPKWRADGFPLLLDEVDMRNGFSSSINELIATMRLTEKQKKRLRRLIEHGHPSRLEAVIAHTGKETFTISLAVSLAAEFARLAPVNPPSADTLMVMGMEEMERRIREANRKSGKKLTLSNLLDVYTLVWAMAKVNEVDPLRDDEAWSDGRGGMESIVVAESIDRLLKSWDFYEYEALAQQEDKEKRVSPVEAAKKYAKHREAIDRVRKSGGDFVRYYELLERVRNPVERKKTMDELAEKVEFFGWASLDFVKNVHWETMKPRLITRARKLLPAPSPKSKLVNDLAQEGAIAVFRDNIDARAIMEQLQEAGLGSDTVKLQIHVKDGHVLSVEDDKIIKEMIERELKEARIREKSKQRQRAYEYVYKEGNEYPLI
ncbi:hypothetical protein PFISCL1PPCAC_10966 [Pristionchus fissidentatus]|uniref:MRH domain-containing protein n=1 Tax=Pristionchus fissidentatus TaxID=1538716 RepID=A0AAV5VJH2_9BILA|nr:hypothetical protein PFISCL1PPCAC_10966 [Pristionchus fissidentatus]